MLAALLPAREYHQTDSNDLPLGFNQTLSLLSYGGIYPGQEFQQNPPNKHQNTLMFIQTKDPREFDEQ